MPTSTRWADLAPSRLGSDRAEVVIADSSSKGFPERKNEGLSRFKRVSNSTLFVPTSGKVFTMAAPYTVHTDTLFDPKKKQFISNTSITVDPKSGLIVNVFERAADSIGKDVPDGDIDLRGKVVMPGFVDAHTHIFLHCYEWVAPSRGGALMKLMQEQRTSFTTSKAR